MPLHLSCKISNNSNSPDILSLLDLPKKYSRFIIGLIIFIPLLAITTKATAKPTSSSSSQLLISVSFTKPNVLTAQSTAEKNPTQKTTVRTWSTQTNTKQAFANTLTTLRVQSGHTVKITQRDSQPQLSTVGTSLNGLPYVDFEREQLQTALILTPTLQDKLVEIKLLTKHGFHNRYQNNAATQQDFSTTVTVPLNTWVNVLEKTSSESASGSHATASPPTSYRHYSTDVNQVNEPISSLYVKIILAK